MSLNIPLLRSSFELVASREAHITRRFYEILFQRHPQAQALFGKKNLQATQEKMLQDALVAVIDHLDNASWLEQQLGALGSKHGDYGVTAEMYGWVGDSLLATLAEIAGPDWSPELASAWTEAYGAIASLMQRGAPTPQPRRVEMNAAPAAE